MRRIKVTPKKSDYTEMTKGMNDHNEKPSASVNPMSPKAFSDGSEIKKIVHRADTRGFADHGWLQARHSFSFANWYDPNKIHFGALRVLNDDSIAAGKGFGAHPHDNMEIVTIPLSGAVRHEDSLGHQGIIQAGEVQIMSAGKGILHSEFNNSETEELRLFQIWIFPNERNVEPRYDQLRIDPNGMKNSFQQLLSPNKDDAGLWIHQNAWINMAEMDENKELTYTLHDQENGVYILLIEGEVSILEETLENRDAIGVWDGKKVPIIAKRKSKVLVLEVPMKID